MRFFGLLVPFVFLSGSVEAKGPRLVTFPIPLLVESVDKGSFIHLVNEISSRIKMPFQVDVLPANKAILQFSNGKADVYFPGLDNSVPKDALTSLPFYVRVDYIFYRNSKPLRSLKELRGKTVGLTFRYHYAPVVTSNNKIKFSFADDDVANMKRLAEGTIDAFIVEERSGLRALELSRAKGISYTKDNPVSTQNCYFTFKNTPEGKALLKEFNGVLEKMKTDGSLEEALKITEPLQSKH